MSQDGLTLTEVLVSAAVVAILASASLPQFTKTHDRGAVRAARDILRAIYIGEQTYHAVHRDPVTDQNIYRTGLSSLSSDADWAEIGVDNPHNLQLPFEQAVIYDGDSGTNITFRAYIRLPYKPLFFGFTGLCIGINQDGQECPGDAGCPLVPLDTPCGRWWDP